MYVYVVHQFKHYSGNGVLELQGYDEEKTLGIFTEKDKAESALEETVEFFIKRENWPDDLWDIGSAMFEASVIKNGYKFNWRDNYHKDEVELGWVILQVPLDELF